MAKWDQGVQRRRTDPGLKADAVASPNVGDSPVVTRIRAYWELTKPGITRMVLLTTAVGFYMATGGPLDWALLVHTLVGVGLAAGGTNALNQWWEREADARMKRTRGRPLPSGRLGPLEALVFASAISVLGIGYLLAFVNPASAAVVAFTLASYVFLYTPFKKLSPAALYVGAVPGALPIVAGWVAAGGALDAAAWVLFGILFVWQLPHFLALGWLYREDYGRGGFTTYGQTDGGARMGRRIFVSALALVLLSLAPTALGISGPLYLVGALVLGAGFLAIGLRLSSGATAVGARKAFIASVVYLPLVLALMAIDKALF